MVIFQKISVVAVVVVLSMVIGLSFFTLTNSNYNNAFAQQQNGSGFDKELSLLNQSLTALENHDKNAKKTLFDAEGMVEDKIKDNPEIGNAEKRIEAAIKMVGEDNFQAAIDHTKEAIKTFTDLNNK
jgi:hypothetical protein